MPSRGVENGKHLSLLKDNVRQHLLETHSEHFNTIGVFSHNVGIEKPCNSREKFYNPTIFGSSHC